MNRTETFFRIVNELQDVYEGHIEDLPTMLFDTKELGDMKLTFFSFDTERFLLFTAVKKGINPSALLEKTIEDAFSNNSRVIAVFDFSKEIPRMTLDTISVAGNEELVELLDES